MIEFIAAASVHSQVFGLLWYLLIIAALGQMVFGRLAGADWREAARIWFTAFGPLLGVSILSVVVFDLKWSRIEVLEVFLGGIIFLALMSRAKFSASRLLQACAAGGLIALAMAANDVGWQGFARAGSESHPINFGIASGGLLLVLLLAMWQGQRSLLIGLGAAGAGVALLLSGSRGPMLALMVVVLGLIVMQIWQRQHRPPAHVVAGSAHLGGVARTQTRYRHWMLLVGGLILTALVLAAVVVRSLHDLQFGEVSSLSLRWRILIETLRQIGEHPWMGLGVDQAGAFYATLSFPTDDINHAHNTLLNTTLEMGIAGGLAWCWVFVALGMGFVRMGGSSNTWPWMAGLAVLAYFFLCAMTQDVLSHSYTRKLMTFHLALLLALAMQARADRERL